MKPREERRNVLIPARLKLECGWHDARIINISSRGMMLQTSVPPSRGTYVELHRGPHLVIARVVWANQNRFGIRAQDRLPVDAIISPSQAAQAVPVSGAASGNSPQVERRRRPRSTAEMHELSRQRSRAFEFACQLAIAGSAVLLAACAAQQVLGTSLAKVGAALDGSPG